MRLLLIGFLTLWVTACAARPSTIQSPEGKRVWTANEVVLRINEFQRVVIDASDQKKIPVETARVIVTWTVSSLKVMQSVPQGWQATLAKTWQEVKDDVEKLPAFSHWSIVFDVMLGVV